MAKKGVNDEFYTPTETIINELKYYGYDGYFNGKTIYLPCDYDATLPYIKKEIKKVEKIYGIARWEEEIEIYKVMPEQFTENDSKLVPRNCQFVAYLTEHKKDFGIKDIYISGYDAISQKGLKFQNAPFECFDVIITNPPFSQMEEWIEKIIKFKNKGGKFIFLAPLSILTNVFSFKYFKNGDFWCGYTEPNKYEDSQGIKKTEYLPSVWLTNFDVQKHKSKRVLTKSWGEHPDEFMPYWNYKGIEVVNINDIPYDYKGVMGIPATALKEIRTDQFELIGLGVGKEQFNAQEFYVDKTNYSEKEFKKYYIKKGDPENQYGRRNGKLFVSLDGENPYKQPFARILVKLKQPMKSDKIYDFEDVIKRIKKELKNKKPKDLWNEKLFKIKGNTKVKHGRSKIR